LDKEDLRLADHVWMSFCGRQLDKLEEIKSNTFSYLSDALHMSKQLFKEKGKLSFLEKKLLKMRNDEKMTDIEIIKHMLVNDNEIGFGDLQYEYILNNLK